MARGDAFRAAMSGAGQTGKVEGMAENETTDEQTEDEKNEVALSPDEVQALKDERDQLREAANKQRTQAAREAKAKADADRKAAKESDDVDALKAQLAAAEKDNATLHSTVQRQLARVVAKELGAVDSAVVVRLIDFEAMADPTDEDELGTVIGALLQEKPYLKSKAIKTDAGGGGGGNTADVSMNDLIRRAGGRS